MNISHNQFKILAVLVVFIVSFGIFENAGTIAASASGTQSAASVIDAFLGIGGNSNTTTNDNTNTSSSGGYFSTVTDFFSSLISTPAATSGTSSSINMTATGSLSGTTPILVCLPGNIRSGESVILMWACRDGARTATGENFDTEDAVLGSIRTQPTEDTTYTINCLSDTEGVENTATSCTIHIVEPELTITATPINVPYGDTTAITWNATDVNSCTVTSDAHFGFSRTGTTGDITSPSITKDTTFTLTCEAKNGLLEKTELKVNAS